MYIVIVPNGLRHSAWMSANEAANQARVLREHGYKRVRIEYDSTVSCENGHYYV